MLYKYKVKIDFLNDFTNMLKNQLIKMGYKIDSNIDSYKICKYYFKLKKQLISSVPRNILFSKEFTRPHTKEHKKGLDMLLEKIQKGEDLTPHLGRNICFNLEFNDDLLNDWDIHHLHLGTKINKEGLIKRTGPLLFARFDDKNAYLIDVMEHGVWAEQRMVEILHKNWPESIRYYRTTDGIGLGEQLTNEDIKQLRKVHAVSFTEPVEGVTYFPIGGGYASDGTNINVIILCDYIFNMLKNFEEYIKKNISFIINDLKEEGVNLGDELHFVLIVENNIFYTIEIHSLAKIKLGALYPEKEI